MEKLRRGNPIIFLIIFFTAVGFGVWGMLTPPPGEVSNSILILIAQFLVLAAGIYGFNIHLDLHKGRFHAGHETETPEGEDS